MFVERLIDLTFILGTGNFGLVGSNTLYVKGCRVRCHITCAGGLAQSNASLDVYGLTKSHMQQLSQINKAHQVFQKNTLIIAAGNSVDGTSTIFEGQITTCQPDFNEQPDSMIHIEAQSGMWEGLSPLNPQSFSENIDVEFVMETLAMKAGLIYEKGNFQFTVPPKISSPYFYGSLRDQMYSLARAAEVNLAFDQKILAIWPSGGSRSSGSQPTISAKTGMIGYPTYDVTYGLHIKTLFNPNIAMGQKYNVISDLPWATATWTAYYINHQIDSHMPDGAWFTTLKGQNASVGG